MLSDFFIQAAGFAYHHRTTCGVYHQPLWGWILLRLYDIQHFVLMICNSFGIDDIHAFGVMCASRKRILPSRLHSTPKCDIISASEKQSFSKALKHREYIL